MLNTSFSKAVPFKIYVGGGGHGRTGQATHDKMALEQGTLDNCGHRHLLTYSMEQSRSWKTDWFAASQGIPRVLWNLKVPHRTHKRPPVYKYTYLITYLLTYSLHGDESFLRS
jgi:hypothetical protein